MKKIFVMLLLILNGAIVLCAQEREKKTLELKDGTVLSGYVTRQDDGSYLVETTSGDVLFYSVNEIRSVRGEGKKQAKGAYGIMERKGFNLVYPESLDYMGRPILVQSTALSREFHLEYKKNRNLAVAGVSCLAGGSVACLAIGLPLFILPHHPYTMSYLLMIAGGAAMITGALMLPIGLKRLDYMAMRYNNQGYTSYTPTLKFGGTRHGIGLALNF